MTSRGVDLAYVTDEHFTVIYVREGR